MVGRPILLSLPNPERDESRCTILRRPTSTSLQIPLDDQALLAQ